MKITLLIIVNNKLRICVLLYISYNLSRRIHDKLIKRVLHAPINLYFDIAPVGKILNSFSRDLNATDHHTLRTFMNFGLEVYDNIAKLTIACYIVPAITPVILINMYLAKQLFTYLKLGLKAINRVGSVGQHRQTSKLCESLAGASVIRAFKK